MVKVIVVLVILIIVAVALYGLFSDLAAKMHFSNLPYSFFRVSSSSFGIGVKVKPASNFAPQPSTEPVKKPYQVSPPPGFSQKDLSPFYDNVRITSVQPPRSNSEISWLTLNTAQSLGSNLVDITGWKIKTNKSYVIIPRGISDYNPSNLTPASDIIFKSGDYAKIYSPTNQTLRNNLRLNKCAGYLNSQFTINPTLPNGCPNFSREEISTFPGACQSFILGLRSCQIPTPNQINSLSTSNNSCVNFLNLINYRGCYQKHRADANFFSNEWRVWLDQNIPLDKEHDRVLLLDRSGLLVNVFIY